MPGSAPQIGATYGTDPGSTKQILTTVRPNASRSKQYQGNKTVKVGGISLQIDADMVASPVVHR